MKQSGRDLQITCQVGESLVAAELGRRGFICTTFAHNVPDFDEVTGKQSLRRMEAINPDLIFVLVEVGERYGEDRFFLMTKAQLAETYYQSHYRWLEAHEWERPRIKKSLHCSLEADGLPKESENNWGILREI